MRASETTYAKVAENCSAFAPKENSSATNSVSEHSNVSCRTCKHFANDEHCVLDLYDQIVKDHHFE